MPHRYDTFLLSLDSGRYGELPVIRRRDKLFYADGAQARVLEACRWFGIRLELLADHFSVSRPALTLILRGCDPIPQFLHPQINLFVKRADFLTGTSSSPPLHVMPRRAMSVRGSHGPE